MLVGTYFHIQEVCYQYWPSSGTQKFGEFKVEVLGEERLGGFVLRTLCVVHSKVSLHLMYSVSHNYTCVIGCFLFHSLVMLVR